MKVTEIKHVAKRQEWQERIMECRSSGQAVKEWCREQGVTTTTYYRWEREIFGGLEKRGKVNRALTAAAPEFAEAPAMQACGAPGQAIMTLRTGAAEVDIYSGAGEREIEMVLRALKLC